MGKTAFDTAETYHNIFQWFNICRRFFILVIKRSYIFIRKFIFYSFAIINKAN